MTAQVLDTVEYGGFDDTPDIASLTEEYRQQELERGRQSLFYFVVGICGLAAEDEDGTPTVGEIHRELCAFLEGRAPHHPWNRAVVGMARGTAKSFWVRMYALWRILYIENFSVLLISNSAKNAQKLHFQKIYDLITTSRRAEYIRWLFQHRFPPGLEGTNSEQIKLIQTDSQADVAFSYGGMETSLEGKHPDLILLDDLEGADAKKSIIPNEAAYDTYQRVIPLPRFQVRSQIIVVGTIWGKKSLLYRLRREVGWKEEADNEWTPVKFFWRPIRDPNGKSIWPERFPEWFIDQVLSKDAIFRTQYLLLEDDGGETLIDLQVVAAAAYAWVDPEKTIIRYPAFKFDPSHVTDEGFVKPEPVEAYVPIRKLNYFIHFDPLHRMKKVRRGTIVRERPTTAAIAVVGVAPDGHAFVMATWVGDADLFGQASQLLHLYRQWPALKVTWESVGAQHWLLTFIERQEENDHAWKRPTSFGKVSDGAVLPALSRRLEEGQKTTEAKEWVFREILAPWLNNGVLHLDIDQLKGELGRQLEGILNEEVPCDIADALAQGPEVWRPSASDLLGRDFQARRRFVDTFVKKRAAVLRTGWKPSGWRNGPHS